MEGYIKLSRKITQNQLYFSEKFTKLAAWIDLIILASYKPETVVLGGVRFDLNPGELCYSQKELAHRWQWDRRTVRKYLDVLKKSMMVSIRTNRITSIITILNWGKYQGNVHQNTQPHARKIPTYKNIKKQKEEEELMKIIKQQYEMENMNGIS